MLTKPLHTLGAMVTPQLYISVCGGWRAILSFIYIYIYIYKVNVKKPQAGYQKKKKKGRKRPRVFKTFV